MSGHRALRELDRGRGRGVWRCVVRSSGGGGGGGSSAALPCLDLIPAQSPLGAPFPLPKHIYVHLNQGRAKVCHEGPPPMAAPPPPLQLHLQLHPREVPAGTPHAAPPRPHGPRRTMLSYLIRTNATATSTTWCGSTPPARIPGVLAPPPDAAVADPPAGPCRRCSIQLATASHRASCS